MMIPKKKETKYDLRNRTGHHPEIKSDRFENVFLNGLILILVIIFLSLFIVS